MGSFSIYLLPGELGITMYKVQITDRIVEPKLLTAPTKTEK